MQEEMNAHVSAGSIRALAQGLLPPEKALPLLEHLDCCPACMDAYIASLADTEPEETPDGLAGRVIDAVGRESRQAEKGGTVIMLLPALAKLLAAVALAMALFFTGVFDAIGSGMADVIGSISSTSAEGRPEGEPPPIAKWSEALDSGVRQIVEHWNAFFKGDDR